MACMHDPRSGQEGPIDANGVVERRPSKTGRETIWSGGYGGGAAYNIVSWSPWIKRPLAARSSMSAGSGR